MDGSDIIIGGKCPTYACSVCRTKYGYKHQRWCTQAQITDPECSQCVYFGKNARCRHPAQNLKRRAVRHERYPDQV